MADKSLTRKGGGKKSAGASKGQAAESNAAGSGGVGAAKAGKAAKKASKKAKKAGKDLGKEAKKAGKGAKKAGKDLGEEAKKAGKDVGKEAKKAGKEAAHKVKKAAEKARKAAKKAAKKVKKSKYSDPDLFAPLTEGERASALRTLTEDKRLANMAKVGRYRVIAVEPFVCKPPNDLAGCRVARVVAYDYASDRSVEATVDLDNGHVADLNVSRSQPMLAIEEEDIAIAVAVASDDVQSKLALGDVPLSAMHYWSWREADLAYSRRSAAVLFGQPGARPSLVVVVDLMENAVAEVVSAAHW